LYTVRMEQASSEMNFLPTEQHNFTYTTEHGCTVDYTVSEYCSITGILGTGSLDTCYGYPTCEGFSTCWQTCNGWWTHNGYTCSISCGGWTCTPHTCCTSCGNFTCVAILTCMGTCIQTCPETCDTCQGHGWTCNATGCQNTCSTCDQPTCSITCDTCDTCDTCVTCEDTCIGPGCIPVP
jgi:hypothetical protein